MSRDPKIAFAHPEVRARVAGGFLDRISLRDHIREAEIGAFQTERGVRQRLRFDVVVEVRAAGPADDDVDRILSYDTIADAIGAALAVERVNLLETLAERVASGVLSAPLAARVFVRIEKLDRGPGALGVEIVREPGEMTDVPHAAPSAKVAYLSDPDRADLASILDRLQAAGPAIICLGPVSGCHPVADAALSQRRIDLLSIEQNCWRLAARDPRCLVVSSRTELDWAVRQGRMTVWAPSKITLDATERPGPVGDGRPLAAWFATQMQASALIVIGAPAPETDMTVELW